jgi:hypothetical protein
LLAIVWIVSRARSSLAAAPVDEVDRAKPVIDLCLDV